MSRGPILLCALLFNVASVGDEAIWLEGEDPTETTFNGHGWYHGVGLAMELLAPGGEAGDWLVHYSPNEGKRYARYSFAVEEGGEYTWWIRLNPFRNHNGGANYSYLIDGGAPVTLDVSDYGSRLDLVAGSSIDIRFIAWVYVGRFSFSEGTHTVEISLVSRNDDAENHGGIDALAFTNFPWAPTGVIPPDPTAPEPGPSDWFMLMAGPDVFSSASITDVSSLLHKPAGLHGPLRREGRHFVFADGTFAKFWGIGARMAATPEAQERQARFYAKHGINMVRQHPVQSVLGVLETEPGSGERRLDPERLDAWDRWFWILRENGIYMTWSCFYPHVITPEDDYPPDLYAELADRGAGKSTSGIVNMSEALQDAEWAWLEMLLRHVNPYTGLAYKDDPALAILEVHNEDCIFWHAPLNELAGADGRYPLHRALLQERWRQWVSDRYGNDTALAAAWGDGMRGATADHDADSVTSSRMRLYGAWEMEADGPWGASKAKGRRRMGDFIRFLAEFQRGYYERRETRLRDRGFQGVTVTTAWKAGGAAADPANIWCDDAMEAIDRHNYFGGGAGGHGITAGVVMNDSHLDRPGRGILSSGLYQVEDKPFIMTEWTQKPPNQWKAEIAPLVACYGMGLQGWDASFHFTASRTSIGNGWPSMSSYVTETPHYLGQFPALSFALYNNHFQEGAIVAGRRLAVDDVFGGIDALSQDFTGGGYDENEPSGNLATPSETLAIGRVTVKIADGLPHSEAADWETFWDRDGEIVESVTGQLTWDYGERVVVIQGDKTQGIVGFAGGRTYDLPGVTVTVETPFVSLLLTPLDDEPLIDSQRILITALARDKQYGSVYSDDGTELLETGGPPLLLEPVQATITMKGAPLDAVRVVDVYGVPQDRDVERTGNTFTIDGRYATYYYEIVRSTQAPTLFVRGDGNADGAVDIADAIAVLSYLFSEATALVCPDASDANDDGQVDIADAIAVLGHLFAGAGPLPAPFGGCGDDPTPDELDCPGFPPCWD